MREIKADNSGRTLDSCQINNGKIKSATVQEILSEAKDGNLRTVHASLESWGIGGVPDSVAACLKDAQITNIFNGNPGLKATCASVKDDVNKINPDEFAFIRVRAIDACGFEKTSHAIPPHGNNADLNTGPNANSDYFSEEQLLAKRMKNGKEVYAFETFVGAPFFTNHENTDIEKARGKIINAFYDLKNHCVFCDVMIDKKSYPKLGRGIEAGYINDVSMGCKIEYSLCSVCANKRYGENDCCDHIRHYKGRKFAGKDVYEINYGLDFIECSAVGNGACPNCKIEQVFPKEEISERLIAAASQIRKVFSGNKMISTAANRMEKSGEIISQSGKLGSKEDLDKLYESLQSVKDVGKNILNRNDIDFSFMKDISMVMEHLQDVIVDLDEAGFGKEGAPAEEGNQDGNVLDNNPPDFNNVEEQPQQPEQAPMPEQPGQQPQQQDFNQNFNAMAGKKVNQLETIALRNKLAQNWDKLTQRNSESMKHNITVDKNGYTLKVAGQTVTAFHKGEKIAETEIEQMKPALKAAFNANAHDAALMVIAAMEGSDANLDEILEGQLGSMKGNFARTGKDTDVTLEGSLDSFSASPESGPAEYLLNGTVHKGSQRSHERMGVNEMDLPVVESQLEDRRGDAKADVLERHLESGKYNTKRTGKITEATLEGVLDNSNGAPDVVLETQVAQRRKGGEEIKGKKLASAVQKVVVACANVSKAHGLSAAKVASCFARHGFSTGLQATASTGKLTERSVAADVLAAAGCSADVLASVVDYANRNSETFVKGIKATLAKEAKYLTKVANDDLGVIENEQTPDEEIQQALEQIINIAEDAMDGDCETCDEPVPGDDFDAAPAGEDTLGVDEPGVDAPVADEGEERKFTMAKVLLAKDEIGATPRDKNYMQAVAYHVARQLTASYGKPALPNNVEVVKIRPMQEGIIQVEANVSQPVGRIEKLAGQMWVRRVQAQTPPPVGTGFQDNFQQQSAPPEQAPIMNMNQEPDGSMPDAPDFNGDADNEGAGDDNGSSVKYCPVCGSELGNDEDDHGNNRTCGNCGSKLLLQESVVVKEVGDGGNDEDEQNNDEFAPAPPPAPAGAAPAPAPNEQQNQAISQASVRLHPYTMMKTANLLGRALAKGEKGSLGTHCPACGDSRLLMASSRGACANCGSSFKIKTARSGYNVRATIAWRKDAMASDLKTLRKAYKQQASKLKASAEKIMRVANANESADEKTQRNICMANLVLAGYSKADALNIANATMIATAMEVEDEDATKKLNIVDDGDTVDTQDVDSEVGGEEVEDVDAEPETDFDGDTDESFDGYEVDLAEGDSDVMDIDISFTDGSGEEKNVSFSIDTETGELTECCDDDADEDGFPDDVDGDDDNDGLDDGEDVDDDGDGELDSEEIPGDMDSDEDGIMKSGDETEDAEDDDSDSVIEALSKANRVRVAKESQKKLAREIAKRMGLSEEEMKIMARDFTLGRGSLPTPSINKSGFDSFFKRVATDQTQPLDAIENSELDIPRNAEVGAKDLAEVDKASKTPTEFAENSASKRTSGNPDGYVQNYIENVKPKKGRFAGKNKKK